MKIKALVRVVLLLFIGASLFFFVRRQLGSKSTVPVSSNSKETVGLGTNAAGVQAYPAASTRVAAYYFHPHRRCPACRHVESVAAQTIEQQFSKQLTTQEIIWHSIDVEDPANRQLASRYEIYWSALVLIKLRDGSVVAHKNLERVWLVQEDDRALSDYITAETMAYLGAN